MSLPASIQSLLQHQHRQLDVLIAGLTDSGLRKMVITGKWSVFENIVHLATYQHAFISRVELMINSNNPSFSRYTAETDPLFHDNLSRPLADILYDLNQTRERIFSLFDSLTEEQLLQKGRHPHYGEMTLINWTIFFLLHEAHHFFTIFKLTATLKKM